MPPYGYFWWLTPGGYEAEGSFGQSVSVFPGEQLVIVINSAWPAVWDRNIADVLGAYIDSIRAAARNQETAAKSAPVPPRSKRAG